MRILKNLTCSLKQTPKYQDIKHFKSLPFPEVSDNLQHFPKVCDLLAEESNILGHVKSFKKYLQDELIQECGLGIDNYMPASCISLILKSSFEALEKINIKVNAENVVESFLKNLEPFPLDEDKLFLYRKNKVTVSVTSIRDEIESQYLAWKLKEDLPIIVYELSLLKGFLYQGRSLGNIKRNFCYIKDYGKKILPTAGDKIYFLNTIPFKISYINDFSVKVGGMDWRTAVKHCPKFFRLPYPIRSLYIRILQSKGFTLKQIKEGLPFIKRDLYSVLRTLEYLLNSPLRNSAGEEDFLKLYYYPYHTLVNLVELNNKNFQELMVLFKLSNKEHFRKKKLIDVYYKVKKHVNVDVDIVDKLRELPQFASCIESDIEHTLAYLKKKFTDKEIIESLALILYPCDLVKKAMRIVQSAENKHRQYGFVKGCVEEETNNFFSGTTTKRKTLQLCLYYLMDPSFSSKKF